MTEASDQKKVSKLSSLIGQAQENIEGMQIFVHYSENNWETSEEINLVLDQNTTIGQLVEISINKFKKELYYDNITKKKFNVRIFKKKKKIPNLEYPICNPNSKIGELGKTHFCLVEQEENKTAKKKEPEGDTLEEEEDDIEETKNENNNINKEIKSENKQNNNNNITAETNNSNNNTSSNTNNKSNKNSCRPCTIF